MLHERAKRDAWSQFELLTDVDDLVTRNVVPTRSLANVVTGSWAGVAARVALTYQGRAYGQFSITINTLEATHRIERTALVMLGSFMLLGALLLALRRLEQWARQPLNGFYDQIQGLSERRFVSIPLPRVAEWVALSKSLNVMVARVRQMLSDRDEGVGNLTEKLAQDDLTLTASRDFFMAKLKLHLRDNDAGGGGAIVRVHDLEGMNRRLGRKRTDEFLVSVATTLRARLLLLGH